MPLLGVHFVLVNVLVYLKNENIDKYMVVFDNILTSFEGFVVAYFYCFRNKEVKYNLKREFMNRSRSLTSLSMGHHHDGRRRSSINYNYRFTPATAQTTPLSGHNLLSSRGTTTTRFEDPRESNNSNTSHNTSQPQNSIDRNNNIAMSRNNVCVVLGGANSNNAS